MAWLDPNLKAALLNHEICTVKDVDATCVGDLKTFGFKPAWARCLKRGAERAAAAPASL